MLDLATMHQLQEMIANGVARSEELQRVVGGGTLLVDKAALHLVNRIVRELENEEDHLGDGLDDLDGGWAGDSPR